ncbi:MAG: hypothetical protein L0271_18630 [Gemmatimonadetes bacterium]|nr:hypothetical protein [Gemmatimonadota bacterium]
MQSHFRPRTRDGWIATLLFIALFLLAQPPIVHRFANRIEPWIAGMPFLYVYLTVVYAGLIAVLIWTRMRGV